MTNDSLAKAIDYLGAFEVAPGQYVFLYQGASKPRYYVFAAHELIALAEDTYGDLTPMSAGLPMPAWWTPERKYATDLGDGERDTYLSRETAEAFCKQFHDENARIITADLETGAEVPA
jgi:hypothetical protein